LRHHINARPVRRAFSILHHISSPLGCAAFLLLPFYARKERGLINEYASAYPLEGTLETVVLGMKDQVTQTARRRPSVVVVPFRDWN